MNLRPLGKASDKRMGVGMKLVISEDEFDLLLRDRKENIIKNNFPWVYLAYQECHEEVVQRTLRLFDLEKKIVQKKTLLFSQDRILNHKEKSLQLFFAGVFLTTCDATASVCLGQFDVLAELLKEGHKPPQNVHLTETTSVDFKNWKPISGAIFIGESIKLYLHQAGIEIGTTETQGNDYAKRLLQKSTPAIPFRKAN